MPNKLHFDSLLSRFKKTDSDDKITTLQHDNGHILKISHKNLSPEHREELEKLPIHKAKGGMLSKPSKPKSDPSYPKASYTEPQDLGTPDKPHKAFSLDTSAKPCINPSCKSYGMAHPNCKCYGLAEGGKVGESHFCSSNKPHKPECQYFKDKGLVEPEQGDLVPPDETPPPPETEPEAAVPQEMAAADTAVDKAFPQPGTTAEDSSPVESQAAAQPQQQAPAAPAQQPGMENTVSPTSPSMPAQINNPVEHAAAVTNWATDHDKKMQADLDNGWIKPETYADLFHNKSTLGKIGTIFGMLIGGAGSGLSGQPHALLSMMDNTIKNDLDAQQKSVTNRQNLVKLAQQGILNDAHAKNLNVNSDVAKQGLSNMMANRLALDHIAKLGLKLSGQPLQAHNQMMMFLAPMVDKENSTIATKVGLASALAQQAHPGSGGQPNTALMESFGGPEMQQYGHQIDQRSLPGEKSVSGQISSKPLTQEDINRVNDMNTLHAKMNDLLNFSQGHWGTLKPNERAIAAQKAVEAVGFLSSSLGTSMTEGTRDWLDKQVAGKNPTSFTGQLLGSQAKLKEIRDSNLMRKNMLLKKMGFTPERYKISGGKKYKEGPNGEAIEVQ